MKKLVIILAAVFGAFVLTACQSTSSSPAATSSCTYNPTTGSYTDTYGNICNQSGAYGSSCASQGLTYNPTTGQWVNSTGVPVACNTTGLGTTGYGSMGGCTYWDSVYPGANYIPMVDPTTGNLVCINVSSSNGGYGVSVPSSYTYSTPVYGSTCPYTPYNDPNWYNDCMGGWAYTGSTYGYGGYGYSGGGTCLGVGAGAGSDYGYGSGFFGICF